jgi:DNA helicase HerA-like ATPase
LKEETRTLTVPLGEITADSRMENKNPFFCTLQIQRGCIVERGIYVCIEDETISKQFIGQVIDGPYYVSDPEVRTLSGREIRPTQKICTIELTSVSANGEQGLVQTRPSPGSKAFIMDPKSVEEYVGATGDIEIGELASEKKVKIHLNSRTLNRHLGIFGTTGSGKSNTLQVITEEASRVGMSVLIFDAEGEYVKLNEPTDKLLDILQQFGERPRRILDLRVYSPVSNEKASPHHLKFGIPFAKVNLEVFSEILGLSAQERIMFLDMIRKTKDYLGFEKYALRTVVDRLSKRLEAQVENPTLPEVIAEANTSLYAKLAVIDRLGLMDVPDTEELEPSELFIPGRVSVIDLSASIDAVRNIVIAHSLDKIFRAKVEDLHNQFDTPILILIEEVHTFVSREKRNQMLGTLTLMNELARRGRKRGISLGLVSQQPARLPPELFETINTRIIHRLSSAVNIKVLRESTGNVPESLWQAVPSLGRGEAVVVSPAYHSAVVAKIRPAATKRLQME